MYPWRPEEGLRLPGAGVIGGCASPDMWVMGTKFGSSTRVNCSLNHWPLLNYFDCKWHTPNVVVFLSFWCVAIDQVVEYLPSICEMAQICNLSSQEVTAGGLHGEFEIRLVYMRPYSWKTPNLPINQPTPKCARSPPAGHILELHSNPSLSKCLAPRAAMELFSSLVQTGNILHICSSTGSPTAEPHVTHTRIRLA